jgi:hypothetical protein
MNPRYLESRLLHFYNGRPENYLNDWARRTGHLDDMAEYAVEVAADSVGVPWGHIVRKQDEPVAETPTECHNHNADTLAPPEKKVGRGRSKATDKSGDPFA